MDVKISDIKVVGRKRELNEEKIRDLANSFILRLVFVYVDCR